MGLVSLKLTPPGTGGGGVWFRLTPSPEVCKGPTKDFVCRALLYASQLRVVLIDEQRRACLSEAYMQTPVLVSSSKLSISHLHRQPFRAFVPFDSCSPPLPIQICCCSKPTPAVQISKAARSQVPQVSRSRITSQGFLAGPGEETPAYDSLDASPWNKAIMALFRRKMVNALEEDTEAQG